MSHGELNDEKLLFSYVCKSNFRGLIFYAGFCNLRFGKSGKMLGSSQNDKIYSKIVTHLILFQNMINSVRKERPELFTEELEKTVRDMFRKGRRT